MSNVRRRPASKARLQKIQWIDKWSQYGWGLGISPMVGTRLPFDTRAVSWRARPQNIDSRHRRSRAFGFTVDCIGHCLVANPGL